MEGKIEWMGIEKDREEWRRVRRSLRENGTSGLRNTGNKWVSW
jgi:hypothetical protein